MFPGKEQKPGTGRSKIGLAPGHSLMDWVRLSNSGKDLAGTGGKHINVSIEELAKHRSPDDSWIAIGGFVFNVTKYVDFHPGGVEEIKRGVGTDATVLFSEVHGWVNYQRMLEKCLVGRLVSSISLSGTELRKYSQDKMMAAANPMLTIQQQRHAENAELISSVDVANNVKIFSFRLRQPISCPVGCHVNLQIGSISRSYTPVVPSLSEDYNPEIHHYIIKKYSGGELTPKLFATPAGGRLCISESIDIRVMSSVGQSESLLLLAAGTGVTPFIRLIHEVILVAKSHTVKLICFNKKEIDIIWRSEFDELAERDSRFQVKNYLSDSTSPGCCAGRITRELLSELASGDHSSNLLVCACGPVTFAQVTHTYCQELSLKSFIF